MITVKLLIAPHVISKIASHPFLSTIYIDTSDNDISVSPLFHANVTWNYNGSKNSGAVVKLFWSEIKRLVAEEHNLTEFESEYVKLYISNFRSVCCAKNSIPFVKIWELFVLLDRFHIDYSFDSTLVNFVDGLAEIFDFDKQYVRSDKFIELLDSQVEENLSVPV